MRRKRPSSRRICRNVKPDRKEARNELQGFQGPELQKKLRNASSPEELLALAKEQGLELSDEQLEAVSGGGNWSCWDIDGCTDVCSKYDAEWMHECWKNKYHPERQETRAPMIKKALGARGFVAVSAVDNPRLAWMTVCRRKEPVR